MEASRSERKAPFVRRMASSGQKMASAPGKKAADGPRKAFSRQQRPYFLRQMPRAPPNPTRHVRLREAEGSDTKERKFEDVVRAVEQATVLVLVY